jgi:hypothetical protein
MPWPALIVTKELDRASQVQISPQMVGPPNEIVVSPPNEIVLNDFGEKKVSM